MTIRDNRGRFMALPAPLMAIGIDRIDGHHVLTREVLPARTPRRRVPDTEWTVPLWQLYVWVAICVTTTVLRHIL